MYAAVAPTLVQDLGGGHVPISIGAALCLTGTSAKAARANFAELRQREVRLSPGPIGENFSGSCIVTSRNSLIHNGATTATKSERFGAEWMPPCCCRALTAASERLLAIANFVEFFFFPRTSVNKGKR